ncbi:MAG TPA: exonuclease domain-containing protein [Casimicrobiaceae bacterium]
MALDAIERSFDNGIMGMPTCRPSARRLAFVDVETTGLSPTIDRIAEIGVVTVEGECSDRWTTLVRTRSRRESERSASVSSAELHDAPAFSDIAAALAARLSGCLLIAHNARFDYAFLRAEFERAGIAFDAEVICTVMLSRELYPHEPRHDLDSLAARHRLSAVTRHRALPDAELLWRWWQTIHRQWPSALIDQKIARLLVAPILPAHLDASLIERMPEAPGVYALHADDERALVIAAAANLKRAVVNYFRTDHASARALEYSHRITDITWRVTAGVLGARLHAAALHAERTGGRAEYTWQFAPDAVPSISIVRVADRSDASTGDCFSWFASKRKAANALVRLARKHRLCHALLGVSGLAKDTCQACPVDQPVAACIGRVACKKQLMRVYAALDAQRRPRWPHRGPVGIRERSELHVVDAWRFLGTARNEADVHHLLEDRARGFDPRLYALLDRTLARLPPRRIVNLTHYENAGECSVRDASEDGW